MKLRDFVANYIEHNSIVRLVRKTSSGHEIIDSNWGIVHMAHDFKRNTPVNAMYGHCVVTHIASIYVRAAHPDAINIAIESTDDITKGVFYMGSIPATS